MKRFCPRSVTRGILLAVLAALVLPALALPQETGESHDAKPEPPADSLVAKQQALFERINVAEAWKITRGRPEVLVGVIDSGFDFFHPELKGQLIPGLYYPGGYHTEFYENVAHGTLVSSIIVAGDDPPTGMVGLAPRCRVLTASQGMIEHTLLRLQSKFFREHPEATLADLQKEMLKQPATLKKFGEDWVHYQVDGAAVAVRYLVDHGVKVINISGGLKQSLCPSAAKWKKLEEAFSYAADKGVVIVLAAGNTAARWEDYPGKADTVIVAGATMLNDTRWEEEITFRGSRIKQGSNYGKRLTVMAPVENLVICAPHDPRVYSCDDGPMGPMRLPFRGMHEVRPNGATSSAAPIVTALVALIYSVRPTLDARSVVKIVQRGCDAVGKEGYNIYTGYGRVNFGKSLKLARDWGTRRQRWPRSSTWTRTSAVTPTTSAR
jgi:subtilisin family serine protease